MQPPNADPFRELVNEFRQALTAALAHPAPPPAVPSSPVVNPTPYSGAPEGCKGFLLQCSLALEMQAHRFPTGRSRIAYIISLLSGRALQWAESVWSLDGPATTLWSVSRKCLPEGDSSAQAQLNALRQGKRSVTGAPPAPEDPLCDPLQHPLHKPGDAADPPVPLLLDEGSVYAINEILDSRRRRGRLEYLVDWEGYGPKGHSWVSRDYILDPTMLAEFHQTHPSRPAPRRRGRPCRRAPSSSEAPPGEGGTVTALPGSSAAPHSAPATSPATPTHQTHTPVTHSLSPAY
ncbi:uncharacterized protein LOC121708613 [Alosa sapidissima]|uniref:uncharacterized protein LOC121708613 n=1 Tax=Alosa sapidissima TaxID=34773 RepID=UPI001C0A2E99|nr:uncharacterized protein LOC121708613 [Alosa sapidissima]